MRADDKVSAEGVESCPKCGHKFGTMPCERIEANKAQIAAAEAMHGDIISLLIMYGEDFRKLITEYNTKYERNPSADEFIERESQIMHKNLRKES